MHGRGLWRKGMADSANTYDGEFAHDMKHGQGTFKWGQSGNSYKGNFRHDKRHGYGVYKWLDGTRYEGQWVDDKQHGLGRMVYPEGIKQKGVYVNGKFKGKEYSTLDKRKQVLKILKDSQSTCKRKTVLAVGSDHNHSD